MTKIAIHNLADEKTGQNSIMQSDHTYIHEGMAFSVIGIVSGLASASQHYLSFVTPAASTKEIHFRPLGGSTTSSGVLFTFYEDLSSTGGAAVTPFNRDRASENTSTVVVKSGVTATPTTELIIAAAGAGAGGTPARTTGGGAGGSENEIILLPETEYILKIDNIGAVATTVTYGLFWYEESE